MGRTWALALLVLALLAPSAASSRSASLGRQSRSRSSSESSVGRRDYAGPRSRADEAMARLEASAREPAPRGPSKTPDSRAARRPHRSQRRADSDYGSLETYREIFQSALAELKEILTDGNLGTEFFNSDELEHHQSLVNRRKDWNQLGVRMSRPIGLFLLHMLLYYFAAYPLITIALLDLALGSAWYRSDPEWCLEEVTHWDYVAGGTMLLSAGAVSLVHQVLLALERVFSFFAPIALFAGFVALLYAGAAKRDTY